MAYGTVATDVIQSSTTGTPTQFQDGSGTQIGTLCRAWVNFAASSTPSINASFNVSSVTYTSTGVFTVNFANALVDAKYSFSGSAAPASGTAIISATSLATSSITLNCYTYLGVNTNFANTSISVFR